MNKIVIFILFNLFFLGITIYFVFYYNHEQKKQKYIIKKEEWNIQYDKAFQDMSDKEKIIRKNCPKFTKKGYSLRKLPENLKKRLVNVWKTKKHLKVFENIPNNVIWGTKNSGKELVNLLDLEKYDPELKKDLEDYISSELKKWAKQDVLIHTATFGIREYKRGAVLKVHCDRYNTHVLSAIIHVDHIQDKPWSLAVWDHNNNKEDIYLDNNKDLVLYESIAVMHGRPNPFEGDSYVNIFIHFSVPNWKDKMKKILSNYNK